MLFYSWLEVLLSHDWFARVDPRFKFLEIFLITDRRTDSRWVYPLFIDMSLKSLPWQVSARCVNPYLLAHIHNRLPWLLKYIGWCDIIIIQFILAFGWPGPRLINSRPRNWFDSMSDGWWLVSLKQRWILDMKIRFITYGWGQSVA